MLETWEKAAEYFQTDVRSLPKQPRGAYGVTVRTAQLAYDYKDGSLLWMASLQASYVKDVVRRYYWYSVGGDHLPAGLDYCASHLALACDDSFLVCRWLSELLGTRTTSELYRAVAELDKDKREVIIEKLTGRFVARCRLDGEWPQRYQAWVHLAKRIKRRAKALQQ